MTVDLFDMLPDDAMYITDEYLDFLIACKEQMSTRLYNVLINDMKRNGIYDEYCLDGGKYIKYRYFDGKSIIDLSHIEGLGPVCMSELLSILNGINERRYNDVIYIGHKVEGRPKKYTIAYDLPDGYEPYQGYGGLGIEYFDFYENDEYGKQEAIDMLKLGKRLSDHIELYFQSEEDPSEIIILQGEEAINFIKSI